MRVVISDLPPEFPEELAAEDEEYSVEKTSTKTNSSF
jgi:hypothetical protein